MLNHERSLTTYNNTLLNKIASQVCQVIITIHQQQPELLLEKYRKVQWQNNSNQSALIAKFTELLSQAQNWDELLKKLQLSLKALLIPSALDLPILSDLIANIRQQNPLISELNGALVPNSITSLLPVGIAVLLLDAENLQINTQTEKFLANVCNFPLQVKIAFANWSNRGKLDIELHERGYDLIHVPAGRDNADGKMIAFGSSIHELYPHAKEVLVCSSDKVMTNLCNNLQQHGLIVYQVSQHSENINLFNNSTGETTIYSIKPLVEIPSIEQFILQVKGLIKDEQKLTASVWVKLSHLAKIYKVKHQLHLSHIVSKYSPSKNAKDIFAKYPADLVIHQIDDNSELYVTVFDDNLNSGRNHTDKSESSKNIPSNSLFVIKSKLDLEQALKMIIEDLMKESTLVDFDISILAIQFKQRYGKPITEQIKELKINGSYIKFLQSCSFFQLKQKDNKWEISALNLTNTTSHLLSDINSPAALEEAIKNILTIATNELGNGYIDISILGTKFHQQYGKSITDQIKALKIGGNYMKFLQSSSSFQLKQTGKKWEVAIR